MYWDRLINDHGVLSDKAIHSQNLNAVCGRFP
jgi:hypothetical protein